MPALYFPLATYLTVFFFFLGASADAHADMRDLSRWNLQCGFGNLIVFLRLPWLLRFAFLLLAVSRRVWRDGAREIVAAYG